MLHQTELMAELHQELKWHFDCNKRSTVSDLASAEHCVKACFITEREIQRKTNTEITMDSLPVVCSESSASFRVS